MERDPYNVLGVARDADADAIKRAYRALALRWHPDRNPGSAEAEERFKAVTEAWRVLGDAESRARYDRLGPLYHEDGRPPRPDEVGDLLGRMWRNLRGKGPSENGEAIERTVEITLHDVRTRHVQALRRFGPLQRAPAGPSHRPRLRRPWVHRP
jgi:molecular chaperone DnaJ